MGKATCRRALQRSMAKKLQSCQALNLGEDCALERMSQNGSRSSRLWRSCARQVTMPFAYEELLGSFSHANLCGYALTTEPHVQGCSACNHVRVTLHAKSNLRMRVTA